MYRETRRNHQRRIARGTWQGENDFRFQIVLTKSTAADAAGQPCAVEDQLLEHARSDVATRRLDWDVCGCSAGRLQYLRR